MEFQNAKVVRFVPDQVGKGGAKTQVHSHQAGPLLDTFDVFNAQVFFGRWRRESHSYLLAGTHQDVLSSATTVADASNGSNIFLWSSGPKWDETQVGYLVTIVDPLNPGDTIQTEILGVAGGSGEPFTYTETTLITAAVWPHNTTPVNMTISIEATSYVVHPFYKFSTTDPSASATISILGHNSDRLVFQQRIWNYSSGSPIKRAVARFPSSLVNTTSGSANIAWNAGPKFDVTQLGYTATIDDGANVLVAKVIAVSGGTMTPGAYDNTTATLALPWTFGSAVAADLDLTTTCVPATFLNIKNRCQMCWGGTPNFIFDGTNTYNAGVHQPLTAATYTFDPTKKAATAAYVTKGSAIITEAPPLGTPGNAGHKFGAGSALIGKSITLPNLAGTGEDNYQVVAGSTLSFTPGGVKSGTIGTNQIVIAGAVLAPDIYNGCYVTTTVGTNTKIPIATYRTAPNGTDTVITLQANLAATGAPFTTFVIEGYQLTLNLAYAGITAWAAPATGNTGALSWTGVGPRYAYAYYDPLTGHISNISPIVQVTEVDQADVDIILHDIITTGDLRFTKIKIFRTILVGGSILLQLTGGAGQPADLNNTGGPLTFTDTWPDYTLLNAGTLQAPMLTNNPPPTFTHMVYWDGRIFGSPLDDPSAIRYSADNVQVTFGIPEESFPSNNVLRIPAADGRITGARLFGNQAVFTTERWAYTVVGNNETNYRLVRYSTHMMGVGDYQMTEFTGDTTENTDAVVYLGRDQKLYMMAPGYGNAPMSGPVQNIFTDQTTDLSEYKVTRVHTTTIEGRKLILVRFGEALLQYDYDRKIWTRRKASLQPDQVDESAQIIPECFASMYGDEKPVEEIFAWQGSVRGWLTYLPVAPLQGAYVETFPLAPLDDQKRKRQLNFVRLYVQGDPLGWLALLFPDEQVDPIRMNGGPMPDPVYRIYAAGAQAIEGANVSEVFCFPTGSQSPDLPYGGNVIGAPVVAYRHLIRLMMGVGDLLAMDVCYSDVQESEGMSL